MTTHKEDDKKTFSTGKEVKFKKLSRKALDNIKKRSYRDKDTTTGERMYNSYLRELQKKEESQKPQTEGERMYLQFLKEENDRKQQTASKQTFYR